MIIPDYRDFQNRNELYHYGMPQRSGRYAWGSGDRPYQRLERKASRMENRLKKNFSKADARTSRLQKQANRRINKANIERNSMFKFARKRANEDFNRGYSLVEKKQRLEYRMSKKYERYLKKFTKLDVTMDPDLKEKGLDYYNRVVSNTNSQYSAALARRVA